MKYSKLYTFYGSTLALGIHTVLACAIGFALIKYVPISVIHWISVGLFFFFGFKLIYEGYKTKSNKAMDDEFDEVDEKIK